MSAGLKCSACGEPGQGAVCLQCGRSGWQTIKPIPTLREAADATTELAALRRHLAQQEVAEAARFTGFKPLVIWYLAWALLTAVGSLTSLISGQLAAFVALAGLSCGAALYARYLFNGGRWRVWFFII